MVCDGSGICRSKFSRVADAAIKRATSAPTAITGVASVGDIIRSY
jgi:hypothetical protein